jgi:hypothetical protein
MRRPTKEQSTARAFRLAWHEDHEAKRAARSARHRLEKATAAHLVAVAVAEGRELRARTRRILAGGGR